jgi:hypothetical protein
MSTQDCQFLDINDQRRSNDTNIRTMTGRTTRSNVPGPCALRAPRRRLEANCRRFERHDASPRNRAASESVIIDYVTTVDSVDCAAASSSVRYATFRTVGCRCSTYRFGPQTTMAVAPTTAAFARRRAPVSLWPVTSSLTFEHRFVRSFVSHVA